MIKYPPIEVINQFKKTFGAMSVVEGLALYNICLQAPKGEWVELGSHRGKSSTMLAAAIEEGSSLHLVEPEFEDKEWQDEVVENVANFENLSLVITYPDYSTNVLPTIFKDLSFLFVDSGNHGEEIVQSEKPLYENKIVHGGIIAFHDYGEKSQFTAVKKAYEELVNTGNYEPIEINWNEIFDYVAKNNLEEGNNSWHLYPQLPHPPNFIGALRRK